MKLFQYLALTLVTAIPSLTGAMTLADAVSEADIVEMRKAYGVKGKKPRVSCIGGGARLEGMACLYSNAVFHLRGEESPVRGEDAVEARIMQAASIMAAAGEKPASASSLYTLIIYGYQRAFDQSLKFGADVNGKEIGGSTYDVCQLAHFEGKPEICAIAIKYGHPGISEEEIKDLKLAKAVSQFDIYEIDAALGDSLLQLSTGPDGRTPLYVAVDGMIAPREGNALRQLQVVKYLIARGARPDKVYVQGETITPLHRAITGSPGMFTQFIGEAPLVNVMTALLDAGAEVSAKDTFGDTPLHYAARKGIYSAVELLLKRGAYAGAKNNRGQSALDVAARADIISLLRNYKPPVSTSFPSQPSY